MLSIRCKDRLMFSKAYNNKPRGLSHASWENRSNPPEYQLSDWVSVSMKEWTSRGEKVGEQAGLWKGGEILRGGSRENKNKSEVEEKV